MKRQLLHFIFVLLTVLAAQAQDLCVATYNVRYKNSSDNTAGNGWDARKGYLINLVRYQQPDLLGVQEAVSAQMTDMNNGLNGYSYIGVGRDNGNAGGEYSAIFYRTERMVLIDYGYFWLSDTPDKPSKGFPSKGGSTTYKRIATWGKFYDKVAGVIVYHINTHLDLDETNRQQSYYLIRQRILEIASTSEPVIITGDYNAVQTGEAYQLFYNSGFLYDSYDKAKQKFITNGTCPGFNAGNYNIVSNEYRRIDHLFYTKNALTANSYAVLNPSYYSEDGTATYHERHFSDHNMVLTKFAYRKSVPTFELVTTAPQKVDGVYQISSADELVAFSYIVSGRGGFSQNAAAKAVLTADIDMTDVTNWLPIGTGIVPDGYRNIPFSGTFDGQGHSIQNLTIKGQSYGGLFGLTSGATIKNLTLSGTIAVAERTHDIGLVGYAENTTIEDVHSALNITISKANTETLHIGGIAGTVADGTNITRCSYSGTLTDAGTNTVGGIVGYANGSSNSISYCINSGTVSTKGATTNAGGILGYVNYEGFQMSYCANVGTVSGNSTYAGQIVGRQVQAMTTPPSKLYYLDGENQIAPFGSGTNAASATGATAIAMDNVVRGELTFLLNDSKSDGSLTFFQNIDEEEQTDSYPIIGGFPEHKIVYQGSRGKQTDNTDYSFYVNDGGRLADLALINGFDTPVAFTADLASYSRETTGSWGTIYLPFTAESNDNVQLYEAVPELTEGAVLAIAPCDNLPAYTPGLFHLEGNTFQVEGHNVPISIPTTSVSVSAGNFLLTGTLDKLTSTGGYTLSGNTFSLKTGSVTTNAFEVLLTATGEQPQEITLHIVDATGIVAPFRETEEAGTIYNLSGQQLRKVQKGINIVNGKKIAIK